MSSAALHVTSDWNQQQQQQMGHHDDSSTAHYYFHREFTYHHQAPVSPVVERVVSATSTAFPTCRWNSFVKKLYSVVYLRGVGDRRGSSSLLPTIGAHNRLCFDDDTFAASGVGGEGRERERSGRKDVIFFVRLMTKKNDNLQ